MYTACDTYIRYHIHACEEVGKSRCGDGETENWFWYLEES